MLRKVRPLLDLVGEHAVLAAALFARVADAIHRALPNSGNLNVRVKGLGAPALPLKLKTEVRVALV